MKYQLFPDLSDSEYEELKADIAERGVMVPLEYDEDENLLDGHHRKRICDELGIEDFPYVVRHKLKTEEEKRQHVRKLNLARRHLTKEQRNQVIKDMRADGATLQEIADATNVSVGTVHTVTSDNSFSELKNSEPPATVTGKDGKTYPAAKTKKTEEPENEPSWETPSDPEKEFRTLRSKTVKTVEALMRCFDDLNRIRKHKQHEALISGCKGMLKTTKNWG